MKKIVQYYHNMRIGSKLKFWFLFITLLPTTILGFLAFWMSVDAAYDRYSSMLLTDLHLISESVQEEIRTAELCAIRISSNREVQKILQHSGQESAYLTAEFALQKILYGYDYTSVLHSVYVFDAEENCYSNYTSPDSRGVRQMLQDCGGHIPASHMGIWAAPYTLSGELVIPYIHAIFDYENGEYIGTVVVNYSQESLERITRLYADAAGEILIVNQNDSVISAWDHTLCAQNMQEVLNVPAPREGDGSETCRVNGQKQYVVYFNSADGRWQYIAAVERNTVLSSGTSVVAIAVAMTLLCACGGVLLAIIISASITDPLKKLASRMNDMSGDNLDPAFEPRYQDEIGQLVRSFNAMTVRLNDSINEMLEAKEKQRQAEYMALTVQINPHFLYNTLSTIIYLNDMGCREEVDAVAAALSGLFRISISRGQEMITVQQELEHVRCYLEIQKIRYRDQFDYSIDVDPEISQCLVIKLILQPLAENALYHGIRSSAKTEHIRITAQADGEFIRFEVRDTGNGITEDEVFEINRYIRMPQTPDGTHGIGLRNVNERIRIACGQDCGVFLEKEGRETVAVAVVRRQEKNDEKSHSDL